MDRRELTFSQAEGLVPLPGPLALGELSDQFRALAWFAAYRSISSRSDQATNWKHWIDDRWHSIMLDWHVQVMHRPVDEFRPDVHIVTDDIKIKILNWGINYLFDFLTFALRHMNCPRAFSVLLDTAFTDSRVAYRIIDRTIFPSASPEEGRSLTQAYAELAATEFNGAKVHLRSAAELLSQGDFSGSIRESIHSVEAVARLISPASHTLDPALKALAAKHHLHPALQAGFSKLYGYVNDEKGIRHPLLEGAAAEVDQTDAVYMIGASAAFVSYLLNRRQP